ncbi:hypothetical protein HDU90_007438 [Geranomyces variabilis]|nr:hypothetical protein HDU90_007438 [Geranomyces variabilis]
MTHHQSREPRGQCTMSFNALVSLHTPPTPRPTFLNAKRHTSVFYHFTHCVVVVSLGNMHHDYALDTMTLGVWYPPMLSFALWWLVQVGLASAALGEARAQLAPVQLPAEEIGEPPDRTSRGTDWLTRLSVTNEVARDSFLMLFTTAVIISLVGADNVLAILAWTLFMVTVFWELGTLLYGARRGSNAVINCGFTVLAAPIMMTVFVLAMLRT